MHFSLFLFVCRKNKSSSPAHPLPFLTGFSCRAGSGRCCIQKHILLFPARTDGLECLVLQSAVTQGQSRAARKLFLKSASYLYVQGLSFLISMPFSLDSHISMQHEASPRNTGGRERPFQPGYPVSSGCLPRCCRRDQ